MRNSVASSGDSAPRPFPTASDLRLFFLILHTPSIYRRPKIDAFPRKPRCFTDESKGRATSPRFRSDFSLTIISPNGAPKRNAPFARFSRFPLPVPILALGQTSNFKRSLSFLLGLIFCNDGSRGPRSLVLFDAQFSVGPDFNSDLSRFWLASARRRAFV